VKTISLKKVAVVAVASLGFGLLSVVPARATVTAFTISKDSASSGVLRCAQTLTSNAAVTLVANAGVCFSNTLTPAGTGVWGPEDGLLGKILTNTTADGGVGATLVAASPAQAAAPAAFYTGVVASTVTQSGIVADAITGMSVKTGALGLLSIRGNAVATTALKGRILVNGVQIGVSDLTAVTTDTGLIIPFTAPLTAGTYAASVQVVDGANYSEAITQAFTLTVAASATLAPSASTSHMTAAGLDGAAAAGGTGAAASSTTNAIPRTAVKTLGRSIAQIKVSLFKDDGSADATAHTVSCIVSGVGFCFVNAAADAYQAATARSATNTSANALRYVHVGTDGTAGTGTVTVSVTHASTTVETTLGTHSYSTYGDVAKLEVSSTLGSIGKANTTTGGASATRVAAELTLGLLGAGSTMPAFIVKATDSSARVATATAVPTIASSNGLAVVTGTCALDGGYTATAADIDYKSSTNGVGFYNCNFTSAANAVSGSKSTLTISIVDPADAAKKISTTIDVTIGGSVSTETLAFDKTSYAPGEAMIITRTAKDSAGNPVADGTASPVVTFSKAIGGSAPAAGFYKSGVSASAASIAKSGAFAPTVPGAFSVLATSSATGTPAITAASSVSDANAGLLTQIDALNAKIVALNALIAKIMKKLGVK